MKIESTFKIKKGLAEMLKGGVIMDCLLYTSDAADE